MTAPLFAQQNKDVPIKVIPVKPKKDALKDTIHIADTLAARKMRENQIDVADMLEAFFNYKPATTVDTVTSKPTVYNCSRYRLYTCNEICSSIIR